jgi:hypothetical protein
MQNYIYESCWTQALENAIESDGAKPLIMEMFYKYGLRVYEMKVGNPIIEYLLTLDGFYYGSVWVDEVYDTNTNTNKIEYCYLSPIFKKQRGTSDRDRQTLRSTKLASLMRTLEKNKAVPSDSKEACRGYGHIIRAVNEVLKDINENKRFDKDRTDISVSDMQKLLELVATDMSKNDITVELKDRCKILLDKWNTIDKNADSYKRKARMMFQNPFYVIHKSASLGYVVGKVMYKLDPADYHFTDSDLIEEIEPFRRVLTIEDYESDELNAIFAMYKIHVEGNPDYEGRYDKQTHMIWSDTHIRDLNIGAYYSSRDSHYGGAWLVIPLQIPTD